MSPSTSPSMRLRLSGELREKLCFLGDFIFFNHHFKALLNKKVILAKIQEGEETKYAIGFSRSYHFYIQICIFPRSKLDNLWFFNVWANLMRALALLRRNKIWRKHYKTSIILAQKGPQLLVFNIKVSSRSYIFLLCLVFQISSSFKAIRQVLFSYEWM